MQRGTLVQWLWVSSQTAHVVISLKKQFTYVSLCTFICKMDTQQQAVEMCRSLVICAQESMIQCCSEIWVKFAEVCNSFYGKRCTVLSFCNAEYTPDIFFFIFNRNKSLLSENDLSPERFWSILNLSSWQYKNWSKDQTRLFVKKSLRMLMLLWSGLPCTYPFSPSITISGLHMVIYGFLKVRIFDTCRSCFALFPSWCPNPPRFLRLLLVLAPRCKALIMKKHWLSFVYV